MTKQVVCHVACLWIVCILVDTGSSIIKAAGYSWAAPVSGDFSTPSNWNPAGPPGIADTAIFNLGSAGAGYSVSDGSNVSLSQIDVNNDTVTFDGSFPYVATSSTFPAISFGNNPGDVANVTIGTLTTMVGVNDAIGYAAQTQATVTLMRTNNWQSENLYVGYAGTGTMALKNDSNVTATASEVIGSQVGSQGTMTLDAESSLIIAPPLNNSLALVVGASGTGTLSVKSGVIAIGDQIVIAQNAMSQGTLTLDGAGSQLKSAPTPGLAMTGLTIGQGGSGSMSVTGGAQAGFAGALVIGQNVGSQGTLSVANAQSSLVYEGSVSTASVTVGASGQGSLSVTNGGYANLAGPVVVGQAVGAIGTVSIDGTKSTFLSSPAVGGGLSVTVGAAGQGSFSITGGGFAELEGAIDVGQSAGASGTITVAGANSTLETGNRPVTIGDSGTGLLSVSSGGNASVGTVILGNNALSQGTVSVDGANSQLSVGAEFTVGQAGTGTVTVTNGGKLSNTGEAYIGAGSGSTGSVSVTGPGSSFSVTGYTTIGQGGTGALSGTGGATITIGGGMQLGSGGSPQGTLSLDGAGTSMTSPGGSAILNGSVSVTGGALWSTGSVHVENVPSSGESSTVVVDGAGSQWTSSGGIILEAAYPLTGMSLTVSNGASVTTSSLDIYDTTVNIQNGTLTGSMITNHAGVLIDNGTIQGNVTLIGGQLSGTGTISGALLSLGTIAPGNSPGTLTVGSLSLYASSIPSFNFEINSATGTAGGTTGWNLLSSQGGVSLLTTNNLGTTFNIELTSLTQNNTPGAVSTFDPTKDYHWTFLTAGSPITGFDPADFLINTSGFANPILGQFSVSEIGNSLVLNYTVPEPSTLVLALAGLASLRVVGRRRMHRRG
jgi:T5SS/PEP-CTERM-associated repeat protein